MQNQIQDRSLIETSPLITPAALAAKLPTSERAAATVAAARREIRDVIHGREAKRLVVIVGPCSIHDPGAAVEYAERLRRVARSVGETVAITMRSYFEKPRTRAGWKGLINDPYLDDSCNIAVGIELARELLLELNEMGMPCASELLEPIAAPFMTDLLSWACIGARTSESQPHRQLASGLSMPVGLKNATCGGIEAAVNAMAAASHPHSFLGISAHGSQAVLRTRGNPDRHIVLRGGEGGPNFGPAHVAEAAALAASQGIARPVMVDCSHGNSGKDPARQASVCREVLKQVRRGDRRIMGLMLESNLRAGRQSWERGAPLRRGVSITDGCMGWAETEDLLHEIAEAVEVSPSQAAA
jgi:3-deoxy-7-phosphoheptulonate synthase